MAMRRRIKVAVNLTSARKPKVEPADISTVTVKVEPIETSSETQNTKKEQSTNSIDSVNVTPKTEPIADKGAFKFPPRVEFNRSNSYSSSQSNTDVQNVEVGDGVQVMQMDLQRSNNSHQTSPQKLQRQRIKATPVFGQRRNSFVGATTLLSSNNEDLSDQSHFSHKRERHSSGSHSLATTLTSAPNCLNSRVRTDSTSSLRRERHYSGSQNVSSPSSSSVANKSSGRIRTESTCSVYSDSHLSTVSKSRKTDDHNSNRFNLRREFEARFSNGVPDKAAIKMADLIYYNPVMNPMEQKPRITEIKAEIQDPEPENDVTEKSKSFVPVPQLKLNAKGELILDDKSLEIETTAEQEARKVLAKSSLIYLDENTGMNGFYKRHKRTRDWTPEETIRFYRCLQTIGTDFSMMCQLFPKRTRRDIKLKFKKEERCNAALINKAILHPNLFDIKELKDQFEVEDREREEEEKEKAEKEKEKIAKKKEYKKITIKASKFARALKNRDDAYSICGEHFLDEQTQKKSRILKKGQINLSNHEIPTAKETKISPRSKKNKEKRIKEQIFPSEHMKPSSLVKTEGGEHSQLIYPVDIASSCDNDLAISNPIQGQSSIIVLDKHALQEEAADKRDQTYLISQPCINEYSSTENVEVPRTYVNLDSGRLTEVQGSETSRAPHSTQQEVTLLNSNASFKEPHSAAAGGFLVSNKTDNTLTITDVNLSRTETCDIKPNLIITQQADNCLNANLSQVQVTPSVREHREPFEINNEKAVQKILEDIASGTLQVVSSYDPESPEEIVTEIFMVDSNTGDLCDEPLHLPNELVQSILSVMV